MVNENETPEAVKGAQPKVENELPSANQWPWNEPIIEGKVEERVEEKEVEAITLDEVANKVVGWAGTVRNRGLAATTKRLFDGLDGLLDGLAGNADKKPTRKD